MHNLKHKHLHQILLSCLEKAAHSGFETLLMAMDGSSVNVKVSRMLSKELSVKAIGKATPTVELKLEASFVHNGKVHFVSFCIVHLTFAMHCLEKEVTFIIPN